MALNPNQSDSSPRISNSQGSFGQQKLTKEEFMQRSNEFRNSNQFQQFSRSNSLTDTNEELFRKYEQSLLQGNLSSSQVQLNENDKKGLDDDFQMFLRSLNQIKQTPSISQSQMTVVNMKETPNFQKEVAYSDSNAETETFEQRKKEEKPQQVKAGVELEEIEKSSRNAKLELLTDIVRVQSIVKNNVEETIKMEKEKKELLLNQISGAQTWLILIQLLVLGLIGVIAYNFTIKGG